VRSSPLPILTVGTFAVGTELFVIAGILPSIARDLDVSVPVAGQLVTVFALAYAAGAPLLAAWTENIPRRRILTSSLVGFAVANLLASVAGSFWAMLATRVVAALSSSLFLPSALALAARLAPEGRRGRALAMVMLGLNLATILGVPAGIQVATLFGWRWIFVLVSALSALVAVGVVFLVPEPPAIKGVGLGARFAVLRRSGLGRALALTSATLLSVYVVYTYLAVLVHRSANIGPAGLSGLLLYFGAASTLGAWLGCLLSDRCGSRTVLAVTVGVLALDLVGFSFLSGSFASIAVLLTAWGLAGGAFNPAQQSRLVGLVPEASAAALAWNSSAVYLGQALAGIAGGLVLQWGGADRLGWIAGAFLGISGLVLLRDDFREVKARVEPSLTSAIPQDRIPLGRREFGVRIVESPHGPSPELADHGTLDGTVGSRIVLEKRASAERSCLHGRPPQGRRR